MVLFVLSVKSLFVRCIYLRIIISSIFVALKTNYRVGDTPDARTLVHFTVAQTLILISFYVFRMVSASVNLALNIHRRCKNPLAIADKIRLIPC